MAGGFKRSAHSAGPGMLSVEAACLFDWIFYAVQDNYGEVVMGGRCFYNENVATNCSYLPFLVGSICVIV